MVQLMECSFTTINIHQECYHLSDVRFIENELRSVSIEMHHTRNKYTEILMNAHTHTHTQANRIANP